jgi:hypothetical protein
MAKNVKSAKQFLRDANKEMKSISGVLKIVKAGWSAGYKQAFAEYGITFNMLDVPAVLAMCQKNEQGEVFITKKTARKNEQGEFILNKDGKREYDLTEKVVTTWSATTLWTILDQTRGK